MAFTATLSTSRTNRSVVGEWWRSVDHITLGFLVCLIGAGLILSMAASPAASMRLGIDNPFYFLYRQGIFVIVGLIGAFTLSLMSPSNARRIGVLTLIGAVGLMMLLPMIGYEVKGATRWFRIGSLGLQPSEFAKPAFIVFAAWMFSVRNRDNSVPAVAIVFAAYLGIVALLIGQPDFGQSFLLTLCFAAVFFFAGLSLGWVLFMISISLFGAFAAYMTLPHVRARVEKFLSPDSSDTYQTDVKGRLNIVCLMDIRILSLLLLLKSSGSLFLCSSSCCWRDLLFVVSETRLSSMTISVSWLLQV